MANQPEQPYTVALVVPYTIGTQDKTIVQQSLKAHPLSRPAVSVNWSLAERVDLLGPSSWSDFLKVRKSVTLIKVL